MSALPDTWIESSPVALGLEPANAGEAIAIVAGQWRGNPELAAAVNSLIAAIAHREHIASTALPGGIAIPHARSPEVRGVIGAIGRLASPVDFAGTPVWLVITLVSDPGSPRHHLEALGWLARRASNPAVLEKIRFAPTAEALRQALLGV